MKMKTQKSIVLKYNMKNLMVSILAMVKKVITKRKILPNRFRNRQNIPKRVSIKKILPNRFKNRQNIPKGVSNRRIKSLENNFSVKGVASTLG